MKKFFKILMVMVLVVFPVLTVNAKTTKKASKDPINFYIFYGSTCGYCQKLHNYTAELEKDKTMNSKFRIVDYEVWGNQDNNNLMTKVGTYFNFDVDGVPFYVIGDQYFTGFSSETSPEQIVKAINEEYEDKDYVDVVAGIQNGTIEVKDKTSKDNGTTKKSDVVSYIVLGVTAAIVVAILFGRSSTGAYTESEDEKEEVKEEVKEKTSEKEKKTEAKKMTKKSKK